MNKSLWNHGCTLANAVFSKWRGKKMNKEKKNDTE